MRGAIGVVDTLDYGEIGKNIRQFRKKSGLQQNQLADMIGVTPQHICHIEGGSTLSLPVLVNIAKALDVEPDVLLGSNVAAGRRQVLERELGDITRDASPEEMELLVKIARAIME